MPDKYDEAIETLLSASDFQETVSRVWNIPEEYSKGGILFAYVTPTRSAFYTNPEGINMLCGCVTQIRSGGRDACTQELTDMIRADDRIPSGVADITPENIHVLAEVQRKIDVILNRP